jgi:twitching motility protein PilT
MIDYKLYLEKLLEVAVSRKASDLHIADKKAPVLRINRNLVELTSEEKFTPEDTKNLAFCLMTEEQRQTFLANKELDFSYGYKKSRFRVNVFFQKGTISVVLRLIPDEIKTLTELSLPDKLYDFCNYKQGFILITGPCSHGKSTTLASIIEHINMNQARHIITIEDPIEYLFNQKESIISQREIGKDTDSFAKALKATFREDPDVIMVGEMRDRETMETAITAAETGHLVFATLHTNSATETLYRILDSFEGESQEQIRAQLSRSLIAITSQRLVPSLQGGVVPACEIMLNNSAIENIIRKDKIFEISLVIDTSVESGMVSLNRSLASLVKSGKIDMNTAVNFSPNQEELIKLL